MTLAPEALIRLTRAEGFAMQDNEKQNLTPRALMYCSSQDYAVAIPCSRLLLVALSVSWLSEMGEALHDIAP